MSLIGEGMQEVYRQIEAACVRCGRDPSSVKLCLATKTRSFEEVLEAARHSREQPCIIGENQVQTAVERVADGIADHSFDKHFIGHLQSNKVNHILRYADCIQTIDSVGLVGKIHTKLGDLGRTLRIYIQVNTSREEQKSGCAPDMCIPLITEISEKYSDRVAVEGLMTIGINSPEEACVRDCFKTLASLKEKVNALALPGVDIKELSMGMSGDMQLAIEEGSTMVRVGTAIFGERNYPAKKAAPDAAPEAAPAAIPNGATATPSGTEGGPPTDTPEATG